jgi:septum formation protein
MNPGIDEPPPRPGQTLTKWLLDLVKQKGLACAGREFEPAAVYLAADTIVLLGKKVFGKPDGATEARAMLKALSGKTHFVWTGWSLLGIRNGKHNMLSEGISKASVTWMRLTDDVLDHASHDIECLDKAGAYAFQGRALTWITKINGSPAAVMGLPVADIIPKLVKLGVPRWNDLYA